MWGTDSDRIIHDKYKEYAKEAIALKENPKILKTDCWNEGHRTYEIVDKDMDVTIIEVSQSRIDEVHELHPELNVVKGDVREMPFEKETFDVLIDCSTTDHMNDYERALKEYARVLKPQGIMTIVSWMVDDDIMEVFLKNNDGTRYFYIGRFKDRLLEDFEIISEEKIESRGVHDFIYRFLCKKKDLVS